MALFNDKKAPLAPKAALALLRTADTAYFNADSKKIKPIMSDAAYDKLRESLAKAKIGDKKLAAEVKKYLAGTGAQETSGKKVDLPFYLPSLDKLKTDEPKWYDKFIDRTTKVGARQYVIGPKYDGSSILIKIVGQKPVAAYTRGNGHVGRDVTQHLRKFIELGLVPAKVAKIKGANSNAPIYVRCELCITRKAFKKWQGKVVDKRTYSESRNSVNGILTGTRFHDAFIKDCSVVAFELMDAKGNAVMDTKLSAVKWLAAQGFSDMFAKSIKLVSGDKIKPTLDAMLKKVSASDYIIECDGVVIEANKATVRGALRASRGEDKRPYYAMAYKYGVTEDPTAQITQVTRFFWTAGADGSRIPNVEYAPIMVGKTELTGASAHNAASVLEMNLNFGAQIKVVRSGGVIPHVVAVVKPGKKAQLPKICGCGAKLVMGDAHLYCSKPDQCSETLLARMEKALNFVNPDGLGKQGIAKLFDAKINTFAKVLKVPHSKLQRLLGNAVGSKVYNSLKSKVSKLTPVDWMVVSSAFIRPGMSMAVEKLSLVHTALGKKWLGYSNKPKALRAKLSQMEGLGEESIDLFIKGYPTFLQFYNSAKG